MKQFFGVVLVQFSFILLLGVKLYGETISSALDIDNEIRSTQQVFKSVDTSYNIIENSITDRSVYSVLKKYAKKDEAKLASSWFRMSTQLTSNRKMAFFIINSSYKVKALLSKLGVDKKNPLLSKDKEFLFEKIDYLVNRTAIDRPIQCKEIHKSKMDLYIRSMPIVNRLTKKKSLKKFKILKKGEKFKLLYKLHYKNKNGYTLRWGFIETLEKHQQGWVNLNRINIK